VEQTPVDHLVRGANVRVTLHFQGPHDADHSPGEINFHEADRYARGFSRPSAKCDWCGGAPADHAGARERAAGSATPIGRMKADGSVLVCRVLRQRRDLDVRRKLNSVVFDDRARRAWIRMRLPLGGLLPAIAVKVPGANPTGIFKAPAPGILLMGSSVNPLSIQYDVSMSSGSACFIEPDPVSPNRDSYPFTR
jgi:hypothetical protein